MSRRWTTEEEDYLADYWGLKSFPVIVKELRRTEQAVKYRAGKLGLGPFIESLDGYTLRQFSDALGVHHTNVQRWIQGHGLPAIKRKDGMSRRVYCIRPADFWKWAEQHQDVVNLSGMEPKALGPEPEWVRDKRLSDRMKKKAIKRPWTVTEVDKMLTLQEQGMTARQIASRIGRTQSAVELRLWRERLNQ